MKRSKSNLTRTPALLLIGWLAAAPWAFANFSFPLEGRLTETNGKPFDGPVALAVKFYHVAEGGTPVLTVTDGLDNVPLQEGIFQLRLDLSAADYQTVFTSVSERVFVEITDLTHAPDAPYPRYEVGMTPYAGKIPLDNKVFSYNADGQATLNGASSASSGKLLSADGSGGLIWIDAPSSTVTTVGGVSAADIASSVTTTTAATNAATPGTLTKRDNNGGFDADNILVRPSSPSRQGLIVRGATAQTAALQEWQNASGAVVAAIDASGTLKLNDNDGTPNYVALKSPATVSSDITYTLPGTITAGSFLQTDGSGIMSWALPTWAAPGTIGSTTPNTGAFTTLSTTGSLGVNVAAPTSQLEVKATAATSATSSLNVKDSANQSMLFVRDDGNIGIGTNTPSAKLQIASGQVAGALTTSAVAAINWNTANIQTTSVAAGTLTFTAGSMLDGATYTLVLNNATGGIYTLSSTDISTWKCLPACPSAQVQVLSGKDTLLSIIKVGTVAYVSWMAGF